MADHITNNEQSKQQSLEPDRENSENQYLNY